MKSVKWRYSNESVQWAEKDTEQGSETDKVNLLLTGEEFQPMYGFGACFNELGYRALNILEPDQQEDVMRELFLPGEDRCNFNFCRLPIGANDYAESWYSLAEEPGDFELKHFSIERDKKCLLPYIRQAAKYAPDLKLFASPWSPPTWMKFPAVHNYGKLIKTEKNLKAYADYFVRFIQAYQEEGIAIEQLHPQNEPVADQKFPSCMWTGEELRDFIKLYLGPAFKKAGINTEIWLGTINAPGCDYKNQIFEKWATEDYDYFANVVLTDADALQYISGVSYQWGGKNAIQRTFESWWPEIRLMQSENECGYGDNTWEYARYIWTMLKHYISNGAESYLYWNMILKPWGVSTWGYPQNAMITIDPETKNVIYNPDFYVMKHYSSPIKRGAVRLGIKGSFAGDSLVFRNPDGSVVIEAFNPFPKVFPVVFEMGAQRYRFVLEPLSVNSIVLFEG